MRNPIQSPRKFRTAQDSAHVIIIVYSVPAWFGVISFFLQRPWLLGRVISVPLGMSQHLSTFRAVIHHPHDPNGPGFPYLPEGMWWCREIPQLCCLPTYSAQRGYGGRENLWLCHGMGTSLPGKGFHHRGGNQATRPGYPLWAQLAICPGVTQWGCLPHAPPYWGSPECHDGEKHQ